MATFVLVHGAWHGGWCWRKMVPYLTGAGHIVYTPTLTGLGERSHLLSASIDLTCHIQDVVNVILYEALEDVILVGHSYGGMVITGVADKCKKQLSQLVYLDALIPAHGQSTKDQLVPRSSASNPPPASPPQEQTTRPSWAIPPESAQAMGVTEPVDSKWLNEKMSDHPAGTVTEPLDLLTNAFDELPKSYISCTVEQERYMPSIAKAAARVRGRKDWQYFEIATGHDAMITVPNELAQLLDRIAK